MSNLNFSGKAWVAIISMVMFTLVFAHLLSAQGSESKDEKTALKTVDYVDVEKYMGTWHEIASIPVWFQRHCAYGTTATYKLLPDKTVEVINRCYTEEGELKEAEGRAWVEDEQTNAKLKVSFLPFGLRLFGGDYWIIDLGKDYEYAVVGHPDREYGWILSRTPELPEETMKGIRERIKKQGYDLSKFRMTKQK